MKMTVLSAALGFLSAVIYAQNTPASSAPEQNKEAVSVADSTRGPRPPKADSVTAADSPPKAEQASVTVPADFHPDPVQVHLQDHPGVPELGTVAAQKKAAEAEAAKPMVEKPAAPATIEELKMKQGRSVAELKKKQQEELNELKGRMKASPKPETRSAIEAKKKEYRQAVQSLKDAQKKEMAQFKKDHPAAAKNIKKI